MQVIDRNRILPRNGLVRERRRRVWPAMLLVIAILAAISSVFGASAALMAVGIIGAILSIAVIPSVKRVLWAISPSAWQFVFIAWLVITLGLCLSFAISAMSTHRAVSEARATVMALGLSAAWFMVTRIKRAGGAYKFAVMLALAEVGRLIAIGMTPQPVSFLIWIAAAVAAWRTLTYRSGLSF